MRRAIQRVDGRVNAIDRELLPEGSSDVLRARGQLWGRHSCLPDGLRAQGEKTRAELDKYKAELLTLMEAL
ncbi:MAG: hypothetical protein KJ052_12085 [Candidatus Hydrogenedentes bacterium]|nr:hypothetical protein [Candidatus Hydrogenedentota bacterium]